MAYPIEITVKACVAFGMVNKFEVCSYIEKDELSQSTVYERIIQDVKDFLHHLEMQLSEYVNDLMQNVVFMKMMR